MPHQCVHCRRVCPAGSKELLEGCNDCGSHFFFYIKKEHLEKIKENLVELNDKEKVKIEKDIREMTGISNDNSPIILDIESVRVLSPGKYEIDIVNVFNNKRPLIYKLSEGKYIVDLSSTLKKSTDGNRKISVASEILKSKNEKKD